MNLQGNNYFSLLFLQFKIKVFDTILAPLRLSATFNHKKQKTEK